MRIGILCSRVRVEEKLLFAAFEGLGVSPVRIDERALAAPVGRLVPEVDVLLERSVSATAGLVATQIYEAAGVRVINDSATASVVPPPRSRSATMSSTVRPSVEYTGAPASSAATRASAWL